MKIRYAFMLITFAAFFSSCEKDPIVSTPDMVGLSKVTYYPIITVSGSSIVAIVNGTSFTDPGVKAIAGTTDVPVVTSGDLNTSEDGVYTINYTATNSDGFSSTASRTVVVYSTTDDAASHDLSGTYLRPATGVTSTWTRIAPGVYRVQNPGGAASGTDLIVVAVNPAGYQITVPSQRASDGSISSTNSEAYTNSTPATYKWRFLNPTYGTGIRTFVKQ
ncbi:MAG: immunoglobulin-like domain-containing protein [Ginsengibacter sp.]